MTPSDYCAVLEDIAFHQERLLRLADKMVAIARSHAAMRGVIEPIYDLRAIAIARTRFREGFLWLNEAVVKPDRIMLPEDRADER